MIESDPKQYRPENYNNIGISDEIDFKRIRKLLLIGLLAAVVVFIGDWILGYGVSDKSLTGIEFMLSAYVDRTDTQIFWSSITGFIGIPLEGLCYFGIYRLMAKGSPKLAHLYRSGILGYLAFGGCGIHVFCLAAVYFYKYMHIYSPENALAILTRFGVFFMLPTFVVFVIFFLILCIAQMMAFLKKKTPYPKWCFIFNMLFPMIAIQLFALLPENAILNAISSAWISIGNIWMFSGLLITMRFADGYKKI